MDVQPALSRRTVLAGAGVVVGGIAGSSVLAACGGSGSSGGASAPAGSGSGASGGSGSANSLATLNSIPDGSTVSVENPNGGTLLLTRQGGNVTALNAKCTHQGCTVAPQGSVLQCPCHGSEFQPGSGNVLQGPATSPLAKVNVTVTNGQVTLA